ncbi:hypothetical protein AGMMS49960_21080 [Betaproteobacteria bacterium]|nr:hypothetical protein AGMMS49543_08770 [Betaproteobacteria bacterium]GHU04896.1 hypothetical protein AGMMS49960_21080 [Betaproteobacteria bacterium]GHU18366.1 hypothetical protein AGMMS50243_08260 [Betaproteobacteria bacterium]
MEFEHLLEVNEAAAPVLDRDMLWFGLLCRAEDARPFLPGLDSCRIIARTEGELVRELHFGAALIRDRVILGAPDWIRFESEASSAHAGGSLTISIEEQGSVLLLRFHYQTSLGDASREEAACADFVRSAYCQSDFDTLNVIRALVTAKPVH